MSKERILVVDDSIEILRLLKDSLLIPLGYSVLTAKNGREGLEMALEKNPDLILLDMNMPEMTGIEMLIALRQSECQAPVIFITAEDSLQIAVEAFRLGVVDYLCKPFTLDVVEESINRALEQKRLKSEYTKVRNNLVKAETIRQTIVTLSHYLNNDLMAIEYSLDNLGQSNEVLQAAAECTNSLERIKAVMKVLKQVTQVKHARYHKETSMIDIDTALKKVLAKNLKG
jgi:DNA-binding response OmpR family regulator